MVEHVVNVCIIGNYYFEQAVNLKETHLFTLDWSWEENHMVM